MSAERFDMRSARWIICCVVALAIPASAVAAGPTFCFIGLRMSGGGAESSSQDSAAVSASSGTGNARDQLHRLAIQLSRQFESSPDYQQAELAAAQALSAYHLAQADALNVVRSSPQGIAAQVEIDRLERQLDEARARANLAGKNHSAEIDALAMELLDKRSAVSRREVAAVAGDDKLATLRYAWLDANAKSQMIRDGFSQQLHSDPQWKNARAQLEQSWGAMASASN
jgi:hypothetical protein